VKFFVTRNSPLRFGLTFDPLDPGAFTQRVVDVSGITDATNPDLRPSSTMAAGSSCCTAWPTR
jgi:hypothetical protein